VRDYLPKLRGRHRAHRIGLVVLLEAWIVIQPWIWFAIRPTIGVALAISLGGFLLISALAVGVAYMFTSPLRAKSAELRRPNNVVFCITLDSLWMPLGESSSDFLGPGFLIVGDDGIRIVDDTDAEILAATWPEIVDVRPNRAPRAIAEIVMNRDGDITEWWFYVFGPGAFLRRRRRGIDRFVEQVNALRPEVAA